MSVDFAAQVVCFDLNATGDEIEGSDSQDKTKSREGFGVPDLAGLKLKASRFVIQEVFLDSLFVNDKKGREDLLDEWGSHNGFLHSRLRQ
jgi:hypothetical protein